MRISDWSSDVCSSDLALANPECRRGLVLDQHARGAVATALRAHQFHLRLAHAVVAEAAVVVAHGLAAGVAVQAGGDDSDADYVLPVRVPHGAADDGRGLAAEVLPRSTDLVARGHGARDPVRYGGQDAV